jgi:hypothetical protein
MHTKFTFVGVVSILLMVFLPSLARTAGAQAFLEASNFGNEMSLMKEMMSKPLDELLRLQAAGDPYAQVAVGSRYMVGDGLEESFEQAFRLFDLSARQGNPFGEEALGNAYETGRGTEVDLKEAFYWNRQAAMQGHPSGIYSTAYAFLIGAGTAADPLSAYVWISLLPRREDVPYESIYDLLDSLLTKEEKNRASELVRACVISRLSNCP